MGKPPRGEWSGKDARVAPRTAARSDRTLVVPDAQSGPRRGPRLPELNQQKGFARPRVEQREWRRNRRRARQGGGRRRSDRIGDGRNVPLRAARGGAGALAARLFAGCLAAGLDRCRRAQIRARAGRALQRQGLLPEQAQRQRHRDQQPIRHPDNCVSERGSGQAKLRGPRPPAPARRVRVAFGAGPSTSPPAPAGRRAARSR